MFNPMLKDKKYLIAGIITLVLAVGIVGVKAADNRNINDLVELAKVVNEGNSSVIESAINFLQENGVLGASGTRFPHGISADSTSPSAGEVRGTTFTATGAVTFNSTVSNNGIVYQSDSDAITAATTTPCAIQSPNASSTLAFGSAQFSLASSTEATVLTIAKSATAYATTTQIGTDGTIAAGAQATFIASTTSGTIGQTIFAPNEWLVFGLQGGTYTSGPYPSAAGTCKAQFIRTD